MDSFEFHKLTLENVWQKQIIERREIIDIWRQFSPRMDGEKAEERLKQIVFLVKNEFGQVVGISTAFKTKIKQLGNYLYAVRLLIVPSYRIPGLMSKLLVSTRDFLEAIHGQEAQDKCIGVITLVENEQLKRYRNEAVWPASKFVYIGNSGKGHHIRVYYFKGAIVAVGAHG